MEHGSPMACLKNRGLLLRVQVTLIRDVANILFKPENNLSAPSGLQLTGPATSP
jgi:hypothetical protein